MGNARAHNHARRRNRATRTSVKRDGRRALLAGMPAAVRARWAPRATLRQNYAALGLAAHVSAPADVARHAAGVLAGALAGAVTVEWTDLPAAADVAAKVAAAGANGRRPRGHVTDEDVLYAAALRRQLLPAAAAGGAGAGAGAGAQATAEAMARGPANWRQLSADKVAGLLARVDARKAALAAEAREAEEAAARGAGEAAAAAAAAAPPAPPAPAPAAKRRRAL